jgi:hypothetical protein
MQIRKGTKAIEFYGTKVLPHFRKQPAQDGC